VNNEMLRQAVAEGQGTQVEIEAKWGQILDRVTKDRIAGIHESECVVRRGDLENTKFESTMSEEQHKRMNIFLNGCVVRAKSNAAVAPKASRAPLDYKHVRRTDSFYELNQAGFDLLAPTTRASFNRHPDKKSASRAIQAPARFLRKSSSTESSTWKSAHLKRNGITGSA